MFVLESHITIGKYDFDFVHEVTTESTWSNQTDTATIMLPSSLLLDKNKIKDAIPKGSEVTIRTAYDGRLNTIFTGFVSGILPKVPIEFKCEDLMWKLKQLTINENAKNESMQSYLQRVIPGYEIDCFDIHLNKFIAHNLTAAQVLNQIKSDFGFPSFVRNGKIVVGKQYDPDNNQVHRFVIDNISGCNVKSNNLEFKSKDDVKLKVTAISNLPSGEKIEVELGDKDGESRTLNFYDLSEKDLRAVAEKEIERMKYDGYRGDFTAYGEPFVKHGDIVELINDQGSDKVGRYWVDGCNITFGVSGYQQVIKLGPRVL